MWKIDLKAEQGGILIQALIILTFIASIVMAYGMLMQRNTESMILHYDQRQASYAALSGIEYAIKRILTSEGSPKLYWREKVDFGDGMVAHIESQISPSGKVIIFSTGMERTATFKMRAQFQLVDLSRTVVVATGTVAGVEVIQHNKFHSHKSHIGPVYQNAPVLPVFDDGSNSSHTDNHWKKNKKHPYKKIIKKQLFNAFMGRTDLILADHMDLIKPPVGIQKIKPWVFYLPQKGAILKIGYSRPQTLKGIIVINGNVQLLPHTAAGEVKLRLQISQDLIRKLYQKYSVNESPYLIRNLQIETI